jgi:hypothetical protein
LPQRERLRARSVDVAATAAAVVGAAATGAFPPARRSTTTALLLSFEPFVALDNVNAWQFDNDDNLSVYM